MTEVTNLTNVSTGGLNSTVDLHGPIKTQLLKIGNVHIIPKVTDDGKTYLDVHIEEKTESIHNHIDY